MTLPPLKWVPSPNFSARTAKIDLIVIHDCQGGYDGSIAVFQSRTGVGSGPVSAHIVLNKDGTEATQMVAFGKKAWHVAAFNSRSIGIEMEGFEEKGYPDAEWGATAETTAYLCHRFGIPPKWAPHGDGPGVCRHLDLGAAGGGHVDPTQDMGVWQAFLTHVASIYAAGDFPGQPWGR